MRTHQKICDLTETMRNPSNYLIFIKSAVESASSTPLESCKVAETIIFLPSEELNFARKTAKELGIIGRLKKAKEKKNCEIEGREVWM